MAFITFQLQAGRAKRTEEIRARMQGPLPRPVTEGMAAVIRRGPGSVEEQFARQAEMGMTLSAPWKRTRDFGSRKAPSRTLHDKGRLEAAWTGRGAGSVTVHASHGVTIGVDSRIFPQAAMFQRSGITLIPVTPRSRMYLGLAFGVWLKKSTTRLKVEGRPVAMNRDILRRAKSVVGGYYLRGAVASSGRAA